MYYRKYFKNPLNFVAAVLFISVASPIILILTVLLFIDNKGKPFFFQQRPGLNGKSFKLVKFKTMRDLFHPDGRPLPDKDRITKLGQFVRKSSLDELPQLFNVLIGDMGIVGPRPLLVRYLPLYTEFQFRRHEVKPGITGWAQVNGRNAISWDQKFEYDVWYIDHITFALDWKIFFMTLSKASKSEGVDKSTEHTMTPFDGNN